MHIGLVLPSVPAYSETFFRNKIIVLQKLGMKVTLYASGLSNGFNLCAYYPQPPLNSLFPFGWIKIIKSFLLLSFKRPNVLRRLYLLERSNGKSQISTFKTILANSHILQHQLDWLHFGFGTMAIGRENIANAIGAKMAISHRGYDITIYPLKFPGCYIDAWKNSKKIHILSDALGQKAISLGLNAYKRVHKITPAIDINHFQSELTSIYINFQKPLIILTVARLKWVKGIYDCLKALSILKKQNIPFDYTVIGDGEELERLVFAAHQLGIRSHVHFLGKQTPDIVKQAMGNCDIYLQYSITEGFCNAVLEAQAMGCLCVVSDAEGLPENVIHGVTGWVVPKRDPELLAQTLNKVSVLNSKEIEQLRFNAAKRVRESFNLENQMEQFREFYTTE